MFLEFWARTGMERRLCNTTCILFSLFFYSSPVFLRPLNKRSQETLRILFCNSRRRSLFTIKYEMTNHCYDTHTHTHTHKVKKINSAADSHVTNRKKKPPPPPRTHAGWSKRRRRKKLIKQVPWRFRVQHVRGMAI